MFRSLFSVIRSAASALGLMAAVTVAQADELNPLDYYPLVKGNKWEYKFTIGDDESPLTTEVTKVEKGKDKTDVSLALRGATGSGLVEELSVDDKGIHLHAYLSRKLEPARTVLKSPLKSGESWTQKYKAGAENEVVRVTVKKPEDVKVPAGKFRAIPVETVTESGNQKSVATTWFAEKVGVVKMVSKTGSTTMILELKKFTPAK